MNPILQQAMKLDDHVNHLNFEEAKICSEALYQDGILLFQAEADAKRKAVYDGSPLSSVIHGQINDIPLSVVLKLVEVLSLETIQFKDDLRFSISKTCHLFIQFAFAKIVQSRRKIYHETTQRLLELSERVLSTLPITEVRTHFFVKCCHQTAKGLTMLQMTVNSEIKRHGFEFLNALEGAFSLNSAKIVSSLGQIVIESSTEFEADWFAPVNAMYTQGIEARTKNDIQKIYQLYKNHKRSHHQVICLIESLRVIIETNHDKQSTIDLVEEIDEDNPGLHYFCEYKKLRFYRKASSQSWKVRFCALSVLFELVNTKDLNERLTKSCIQVLFERMVLEKNKYLASFLHANYATLPNRIKVEMGLQKKRLRELQKENEKETAKIKKSNDKEQKKLLEQLKKDRENISILQVNEPTKKVLSAEERKKIEDKVEQLASTALLFEAGIEIQNANLLLLTSN